MSAIDNLPMDPWFEDEEGTWPMEQGFTLVNRGETYLYLVDFPPGTTWDQTWMGDKQLVLGLHETLSLINDTLPEGMVLRIIGEAAMSYVFGDCDPIRNFDVLLCWKPGKKRPLDAFVLDGTFNEAAHKMHKESDHVSSRSILWALSEPNGFYAFQWKIPGIQEVISLTVRLFNGTLREYMDTCLWIEDALAIGIADLPSKGDIFVFSSVTTEILFDSQFLTLTDAPDNDPSETLMTALELCKKTHKKIHINDFNSLAAMIGLHNDGLNYIGC